MIWKVRDEEVEKIRVVAQVRRPISWCERCMYLGMFGSDKILERILREKIVVQPQK
jgi:hypothetical protein